MDHVNSPTINVQKLLNLNFMNHAIEQLPAQITTCYEHKSYPIFPQFLQDRMEKSFYSRYSNAWGGQHILHGSSPKAGAIMMSSNDYLCMAQNTNIIKAQIDALLYHGNGMLMSAIFLHGDNPQENFEKRLANFMGYEAGIVSQSGFSANVGLIQSIAQKNLPVYVDMLAHMSLREGIVSAGATEVNFVHNDVDHLKRQIARNGPGIVIVDSVYSTNGSLCPLTELVDVAFNMGCMIIVDESHSLGTHGPKGAGLVAELGLQHRVHFVTASLAKTFASRGGFITCNAFFKKYFQMESRPAIFSSALLPSEIAGLDECLTQIQLADKKRQQLHQNARYFRQGLDALGYNVSDGSEQIVSIESGTEPNTIILRDSLQQNNLFGSVFCAPATATNRALVRFTVNSDLTRYQLDHALNICDDIRDEVGMHTWASTLRKKRQIQ